MMSTRCAFQIDPSKACLYVTFRTVLTKKYVRLCFRSMLQAYQGPSDPLLRSNAIEG